MLIKLLKYDIMADYKKYCAVYIAMLAASVMILLSNNPVIDAASRMGAGIITGLMTAAFFALSAAAAVMVLIFSISRFYKNLVRDEGYLMHTLPVPTWQLLVSKLITVYIWTIATVFIELICLGIAFKDFNFFDIFPGLINMIKYDESSYIFLIYLILAPFSLMSCIYFAFALGNLFSRNKLGMSIVMYFAIKFAERTINMIITAAVYASAMSSDTPSPYYSISFYIYVTPWILSVGYFIAAVQIFNKKLNLE